MKTATELTRNAFLIRFFNNSWVEIAYLLIGIRGVCCDIEFPSDWHEDKRAWVRVSFGIITFAFSFKWSKVVPDDYQCSGPTYGFYFNEDSLVIEHGKPTYEKSQRKFIAMPWQWRHINHKIISDEETHDYRYCLRNGAMQKRKATIKVESMEWHRYWVPWKKVSKYIDVSFDDEVGEKSGSWKGGTVGCSYTMMSDETPLTCLRRMESERKFT